MSVPLNLVAPVPEELIDSRRLSRFTEQVSNALNALIAAGLLNQTGSNQWAIDPSALPPSGVIAGVYTNPTITVSIQGLITQAASSTAVQFVREDGAVLSQYDTINFETGLVATDDAGNSRINVNLADTAVTPGAYTNSSITVDQQGRLVAAASGTASGLSPLTTKGDIWAYSTIDARFPVGSSADILIVDSAATFGFKWVALSSDVTIATTGAVTIANDAVTYAKMQNVSAASRLLGRGSSGGSGNVEEISLDSTLTMTGTTLAVNSGAIASSDSLFRHSVLGGI